jgi:hypothetical protein
MFPCEIPDIEGAGRPALPALFSGGCHCGAVQFRVTVRTWRVSSCNCSMCTKKGFLHVIVPAADFELLRGADQLTTYRFNTGVAQHHFCRVCGVHSFYVPRSHPDGLSVNAHCLTDVPLSWFDIERFDGQHWEQHAAKLAPAGS